MRSSFKAIAVLAALLMLAVPTAYAADGSSAPGYEVLLDMGNGTTYWEDVGTGDTYGDVAKHAADSAGIGYSCIDGKLMFDGIGSVTIGAPSTGGSMWASGTTGVTVVSSWHFYIWNVQASSWTESAYDPSAEYVEGWIAFALYPDGCSPTETPVHRNSWTQVRGDSGNTGSQTAEVSESEAALKWSHIYGQNDYVDATVLVESDRVYVVSGGGMAGGVNPTLHCYDAVTGDEIWSFEYVIGVGYETQSPVISCGYIFLSASNGSLYRIPLSGPGDGDEDVKVLTYTDKSGKVRNDIPSHNEMGVTLIGAVYITGPATPVFDSGVIYVGASNGMVYCFNMDLELIWSYQTTGCITFSPPTVSGDHVIVGARNGSVYVLDKADGTLSDTDKVYTISRASKEYGSVSTPVVIGDRLLFTVSDGRGMNTMSGGAAVYTLTDGKLGKVAVNTDIGIPGSWMTPYHDGVDGHVYFTTSYGLYVMGMDGTCRLLNGDIGTVSSPLTLVNGDSLYTVQYSAGGDILVLDLNGKITARFTPPSTSTSYTMTSVVVMDGWLFSGNDGHSYGVSGSPVAVDSGDNGAWIYWFLALALVAILAILVYVWNCRRKGITPTGEFNRIRWDIRQKFGLNDSTESHTKRNKRRLAVVMVVGAVLAFIVFVACLSFGPNGTLGLGDAFGALVSAIQKGGANLTANEITVYESRLPRALAAFAVGIGLSIAGAMYQAIIRNPLVDPYIMGVSAGAGTAAVAVIAFNISLFGLSSTSLFMTPIAAIIGGLLAFFATMLIAEKAGGSSLNYVLSGVVVGLAFSALQTLMLSMATGTKLHDSLSWLFGSFANISWNEVWLVVIPAVLLALVPFIWAKEFNLVLLGEDQARQMGLNVRKFNRWMLILASVITSVCVAFVGIIGFVGLVVPHLCRMILGSDHRLVLPASFVIGGALMMLADLLSKMLMAPLELPVGAITTVIGVPVFAYLLIRKGRMYDG